MNEGYNGFILDVEIYSKYGENEWAQEPYLVHGIDDVLWTDSIDAVVAFLKEDLERLRDGKVRA